MTQNRTNQLGRYPGSPYTLSSLLTRTFIFLLVFSMLPLAAENTLTPQIAARLAELPLACLHQEYPNKTGHSAETARDAVLTPKQLHPSFYGCFDWHSSVHGHWMLLKILKQFPTLEKAPQIRAALAESFRPESLLTEARYFDHFKLARTFERTYGWAWLLKLDQELLEFNDPQAKQWHAALQPLTAKVTELWSNFLPKQTYPNRTGVHPNTAFGLVFALDWARATNNKAFAELILARARDYYANNRALAAEYEPDGTDFLSPSLEAADLMRRVLHPAEFARWFAAYYSPAGLANVLKPPIVSDRTDYQIVHLDGLSFSRAWCLRGIAGALPQNSPQVKKLNDAANAHFAAALPHLASGNYGGEHWLASFAVYALAQ